MGVSKNNGFSFESSICYRAFHYFHHPILGAQFLETSPYISQTHLVFFQRCCRQRHLSKLRQGIEATEEEWEHRELMRAKAFVKNLVFF